MTRSPIIRRSRFIDTGDHYGLPRPTSWGGGMARHRWFARWAGGRSFSIFSPPRWVAAAAEHGVQLLCEHGTFSVQPVPVE